MRAALAGSCFQRHTNQPFAQSIQPLCRYRTSPQIMTHQGVTERFTAFRSCRAEQDVLLRHLYCCRHTAHIDTGREGPHAGTASDAAGAGQRVARRATLASHRTQQPLCTKQSRHADRQCLMLPQAVPPQHTFEAQVQLHCCAAGTHGKDKVKLGGARSEVKLAADCDVVDGALQAEVMLSCCSTIHLHGSERKLTHSSLRSP